MCDEKLSCSGVFWGEPIPAVGLRKTMSRTAGRPSAAGLRRAVIPRSATNRFLFTDSRFISLYIGGQNLSLERLKLSPEKNSHAVRRGRAVTPVPAGGQLYKVKESFLTKCLNFFHFGSLQRFSSAEFFGQSAKS